MKTTSLIIISILLPFAMLSPITDPPVVPFPDFSNMTAEEMIAILGNPSVNPDEVGGNDIISDSRLRKGVLTDSMLWPNNVLNYAFRSDVDTVLRNLIRSVFSNYEQNTCIRFRDVTNNQVGNHVLVVRSGSRCSSFVGKLGGQQILSIGSNCNQFGIIAHEFGHALGLYHEITRSGRNSFVNININNVNPSARRNFDSISTRNFGIPYDYLSIMQYSAFAFTRNYAINTIVTNDLTYSYLIGQRVALSFLDIKHLNLLYKCNSNCPSLNCGTDGGYVGPNCNCLCPNGFSGSNCQNGAPQNFRVCGSDIQLTTVGQSQAFQTPGYPVRTGNEFCYWKITAPTGRTVRVTFTDFNFISRLGPSSTPLYNNNCVYEWVDIRLSNKLSGNKFCGTELRSQTRTSNGNTMWILIKASQYTIGTGLSATATAV